MHRLCLPASIAVLGFAVPGFAAETKRPIVDSDLYKFQWIANAQISPDGASIVYTLVKVAADHQGYENSLWIIASNSPASGSTARQLSSGPHDSGSVWSPDGRQIAFVRPGEKDGKPGAPQIWLLSMAGGDAKQLTGIPKGAGGPVWSPDGSRIAFSSDTQDKDFASSAEPAATDVKVITRAEYRSNGNGYPDPARASHIWVVDLKTQQKPKQVTTGEFDDEGFVWSRDGASLYFLSDRAKESYYQPAQNTIYSVSATGGPVTKITSIAGPSGHLSVSPDGAHIIFTGHLNAGKNGAFDVVERSYSQPDLFIAGLQPGSTAKNLTANYDFDVAGGVGGDQSPPRGGAASHPFWSPDGRAVFVVCAEEGRTNLKRIDAETGKVTPLTNENFDLYSYSASADRLKIAALISTPTNIGDLFVIDGKSGAMKQLTHINADLFSTLNITGPEMIRYKSFDGKMIQTWVQRPPRLSDREKIPCDSQHSRRSALGIRLYL